METGYLTVGTNPAGAKIYIDDVLILDDKGDAGLTPALLTVPTGYHSIRLTLDGYCDEFDGQYVMKKENIEIFHNFYIC